MKGSPNSRRGSRRGTRVGGLRSRRHRPILKSVKFDRKPNVRAKDDATVAVVAHSTSTRREDRFARSDDGLDRRSIGSEGLHRDKKTLQSMSQSVDTRSSSCYRFALMNAMDRQSRSSAMKISTTAIAFDANTDHAAAASNHFSSSSLFKARCLCRLRD